MIRGFVIVFYLALSSVILAQTGQGPLVSDPRKVVSIPDIIKSFAEKETEFKNARQQYTYTQDVTLRASCEGLQPGVYHLIVDVMFDKNGNRAEKIKAVNSTLQCIQITKEDLDAFRNQSLIVLTTDEIPNYKIDLVGQQQQDDLRFYVFDVSPVTSLPGKEYFRGRIWVDGSDLLITKSQGTITAERGKKRKAQEDLFPAVTTWRQQVDGRYWFPTYSQANDILHFKTGDVQIDEVVRLTDYKAIRH